jgi:tRNA-splicing ligase RtcB
LFKHVALMPDAHLGKGSMVGSVVATKEAVIPATVGVDIGCGMMAVKTPFKSGILDGKLKELRLQIEETIPTGFSAYQESVDESSYWDGWNDFEDLHEGVRDRKAKAMKQLGTLGGGNHFIEVCLDTEMHVWLMLHSGSRNIGKELAERHIAIAQKQTHNANLPDRDLAVFLTGTPEMDAYRRDLFWAQDYARRNRATMLALLCDVVRRAMPTANVRFDEPTSCHHNYVADETYDGIDVLVTRKGAIRAGAGELGLIPGSMGVGSYVVRGLGNTAAFNSASHGAGRTMSRNKARKTFTTDDLAAQTAGIECRKDRGVLDEIPGAYKDLDDVMSRQTDLVEIVTKLRPLVCVKG